MKHVTSKKTMKTQAVQVNETNEDERQINGGGLNRPESPKNCRREMSMKGASFCQPLLFTPGRAMLLLQHSMMVRRGETTVQSSITPTYEKIENS